MIKNKDNVFTYEDSEINFSMKRLITYDNEETSVELYWKVEEFLDPGTYRVEIFADGNMIGKKSFTLE